MMNRMAKNNLIWAIISIIVTALDVTALIFCIIKGAEVWEYVWYSAFSVICLTLAIICFIDFRHALKEGDNDVDDNRDGQ